MANVIMKPEWESGALQKLIDALSAEPVASDGVNALFDRSESLDLSCVREATRKSNRITEVQLHNPGEKIRLSDGREYEVNESGHWIRTNSR